ncbi:MAG: hypothetical protein ACK2U5_12445 [Candidatus Promineifilaceae bacterium]
MITLSRTLFPRAALLASLVALIYLFWAASAMAQEDAPGGVTQAPEADNATCGIIVYDWNGPVETNDHGFPSEKPPRENFNWEKSPNYAGGELFYRAEIFSQPKAQNMRLQLCFWQPENGVGNQYKLETCGPTNTVIGEKGQVVTWSREFDRLWNKDGIGVDWSEPRSRASVAVKNSSGKPVSNYNNWDWYGENPDHWYPLNMRFTAVAVPEGGEFCGWDYYFTPTALNLTAFGASAPAATWLLPALLAIIAALIAGSVLLFTKSGSAGQ